LKYWPETPWAEVIWKKGKKIMGAREVAARGMASVIHRVDMSTHTAAQRFTWGLPAFISTKHRIRESSMPMAKKMRAGLPMGVCAVGEKSAFAGASFSGVSSSTFILISAVSDICVGLVEVRGILPAQHRE
jgi:hypothetical protein